MLIRAAAFLCILPATLPADTLRGKVVEDHSNAPVASADVKVYRTGVRQLAAELETDGNGAFAADGLPAGDYRIEVSKPNYLSSTLRLGGLRTGLLVRLVRCAVVTGQVVDGQGQPIRGAAVYALARPAEGGTFLPLQIGQGNYAQVDARGRYRLHNLGPGEYVVAVTYGASTSIFGSTGGASVRPGLGSGVQFYPSNSRPQILTVSGGEDYRADFSIVPAGLFNISGKIDLPAPKTNYWLALTTAEQPVLAAAVAETNADGTFRFEGISPGAYTLTASGPIGGYGGKGVLNQAPYFGRAQVSVGGADLEGVSVALEKGRSVSFVLKSAVPHMPEGACPATAQMTLNALEDWSTRIERNAEVNFQKEQLVPQLAPAKYQIDLSGLGASCYQPALPLLDLTKELPDGPVAVLVAPAGSIRGKLVGAARPADFAVALVAAGPSAETQPVRVAFPEPDGQFTFDALRPGPYLIAAQRAGDTSHARWVADPSRMIQIRIAAGAPADLELPAPAPDPNQ